MTTTDTIHVQVTSITTKSSNEIKVYPNPASSLLNIDLKKNYSIAQISIYNSSGQLVSTKGYRSVNSFEFELKELVSGLYLLKIEGDGDLVYKKVLIEK